MPGKKKTRTPREIFISGVVGEGPTNRTLEIPVVVDGKLQGHIELRYTLENIREQLADNFRRRLFALLGVFALGLAVILVIVRNATQPIERLAEGAARVAEGRLDVTVAVDRDDEIGQLAAAFNHMTGRLRERQLLEARLAAAEKRAEIGQLASGLAHEIKNPLERPLPRARRPEAPAPPRRRRRRRLRDADRGAARGDQPPRDAHQQLPRVRAAAPGHPRRPPTSARSSTATLSDLSETAEQARVTVTSDDRARPAAASTADASLVKSALWNLVQNAVQAMERTGGTLRVAVSPEAPEAPAEGGGLRAWS